MSFYSAHVRGPGLHMGTHLVWGVCNDGHGVERGGGHAAPCLGACTTQQRLRAKHVHVHVLAISADPGLCSISAFRPSPPELCAGVHWVK